MANAADAKYRMYWWLVDNRCGDDQEAESADEYARAEYREQWFEFVDENIGNWDYN